MSTQQMLGQGGGALASPLVSNKEEQGLWEHHWFEIPDVVVVLNLVLVLF